MISENEFKILQNRMADKYPATAARKAAIREREVERDCSNLLAHDGWRGLKTDPVSDRKRGKGFGEPGMGDYLFLRYGVKPRAEVLWVEWKRPVGGVVSDAQRKWHAEERNRGALTWIAGEDFEPTVDGFWEHYKASGLYRMRRDA